MGLHIDFEAHSYYMGFAIKKNKGAKWEAYTDNGNTYQIDVLEARTLEQLKHKICDYHLKQHNGYGERLAKRLIEYIRNELREERISYGELAELKELEPYINKNDVELLQAVGKGQ